MRRIFAASITVAFILHYGLPLPVEPVAETTSVSANKHCTARGGCSCDCSWATPGKCGSDDGSCCWGCCCGTTPTPPPGPNPPPTPPTPPSPPSNGTLYCPQSNDFNVDGGSPQFHGNGWTIAGNGGGGSTGGGRVSSKTSWNLLGGYMEFDMDTSNTKEKVNANFYTSSPPQPNCGASCYCDGAKMAKKKCLEMDIIEANGHCAMASTPHTNQRANCNGGPCGGGQGNCDAGGCQVRRSLPSSGKFHVKAVFGTNGFMTVYVDGVANANYSPMPDSQANQEVVDTMKKVGAVIESSIWTGWVPTVGGCSGGSDQGALASSSFSVSNVKVQGTVVQGPEPTKC